MSNLFKKVTSTVSVLAIAASAMGATASVSAASEFLTYAEMLSTAGVINSATEANYRLGDNITRAEVAKIAVMISGVEVYDCVGDVFSDVPASFDNTLCSAIETAAAEGFVNANVDTFRPTALVTRAEMVKMLLAAKGVEMSDKASSFKDVASLGDLAGYINAGVEVGALRDGEYFRPNANATRGEAFKVAATVNDLDTETPTNTGTTSTGTTSTGTTSTGVVTAGDLSVMSESSAMQYVPMQGTVKAGKVTFAAKSSDVTVKNITMKRGGLGNRSDIDTVWFEYMGKRVTTQASVNSDDTVNVSFTPSWKLMAGTTASLDLIVKFKSSTTTSGGQHNFAIVAAKDVSSTSATISASFPVVSNTLVTTNYVTAAANFYSNSATTKTIKVGETSALLGEFNVDVTTDRDVKLTSVSLYNSGTLDASKYLSNLAIYNKSTGAKVSSSVVFDGRTATFVVSDEIKSSIGNRVYQLKADIVGTDRPSETLQFSFDGRNDNITIEEVSTGYRATTTLTSTNGLYNTKIEAGSLSFATEGSTASVDVSASTSDVKLMNGKVVAKEQVKLRDLKISFAVPTTTTTTTVSATGTTISTTNGAGVTTVTTTTATGANSTTTTPATFDKTVFTNAVSRVRVTLGGQSVTVDAASFNAAGEYIISNTFIVEAGTSPLTISADIRAGANANTVLKLNNVVATTSFADARYTSSDQQVSDRFGSVSPIQVTVKGATVSLSNQSVASTTSVKGAKNVSLIKYQIVNNDISDVTVNGDAFTVAYSGADINLLKNMTVDMYVNGELVESKNVSVDTTATLAFNKTFNVAKSTNATIELKAQEIPQLLNTETLRVTRPAASNMSDLNGKTITTAATTGNLVTIANSSVIVAVDANDVADILAAGKADQEIGKIRVTAKNDDLSLREIKIPLQSNNMTAAVRLLQSPTLVDATGKVIANGTVNTTNNTIEFTTISGFTVAKNTDAPLSVRAMVSTLATSEVNTTVALDVAGLMIKAQGSVDEVNNLTAPSPAVSAAGVTAMDLISGGKLVVAANGVQDSGLGYVKYTLTNNGSESVKLSSIALSLDSTASGAKVYKDSVTATNLLGTGTSTVNLTTGSATAEIAAGQSLVLVVDFDGAVSNDNATLAFSVTDMAYLEKVDGSFVATAVASIKDYKASGLPAATSYSRSSGSY